ncbi:MAG TPA: hypothetical protein VNG13_15105 [Mycobacteriales bacterium]|nr:hypothetical protein [Mycobacteriales bacterium]
MRWKLLAGVLVAAAIAPAVFTHVAVVTVHAALAALTQLVGGRG